MVLEIKSGKIVWAKSCMRNRIYRVAIGCDRDWSLLLLAVSPASECILPVWGSHYVRSRACPFICSRNLLCCLPCCALWPAESFVTFACRPLDSPIQNEWLQIQSCFPGLNSSVGISVVNTWTRRHLSGLREVTIAIAIPDHCMLWPIALLYA